MSATADADDLRPVILPQWLRGLFPAWLKPSVRSAICSAADAWDWARGERDPLVPPAWLRVRVGCFASYLGRARYRKVGAEFAAHLERLAGLGPDSRVLDIGCGCGQMASALVGRLGPAGLYQGMDPDAEAIAWCREAITLRHDRFRFTHADLAHPLYNPVGHMRTEQFRLPYPDAAFDVILLKSIFTHLAAAPMRHYLREIGRLLAPAGRCLATGFFLDDEAHTLIASGRSAYSFQPRGDGSWIFDPRLPDYVTAHDEESLLQGAAHAGLRLAAPIRHGAWSGRPDFTSFQDIAVLCRERRDGP